MPQSLSELLIHLVFSTKNREPFLHSGVRAQMHAYLTSTVRKLDSECHRVGGTADHVHLAIRNGRTVSVAKLVETVKSGSSKWIKTADPALAAFSWQNGYGAFSLSKSHLASLVAYIEN